MQKFPKLRVKDRQAFEEALRHYEVTKAHAGFYTKIVMESGMDADVRGFISGPKRIRKKRLKKAFIQAARENVLAQLEVVP